jgi:CO/xanthine dehydrogenase Mo-binding subunit
MAIMLGGAAAGAAKKLRSKLAAIAAHNLVVPVESLEYENGSFMCKDDLSKKIGWDSLVEIAPWRKSPPTSCWYGAWVTRENLFGKYRLEELCQLKMDEYKCPLCHSFLKHI